MAGPWNIDIAGQFGMPGGPMGPTGATGTFGPGYLATSITNLPIATGPITVLTQAGLAYQPGARARLSSNSQPSQWMEGVVTAYSGTSLTVNVDLTNATMGPPPYNYQVWIYSAVGTPTWTTPANSSITTAYRVRMVAGGGGGAVPTAAAYGGGGGGGEYKEFILSGVAASTAVLLTIGQGGPAMPSAGGTPGSAYNGTDTTLAIASMGTTVNCKAGQCGGTVSAGVSNQYPGLGGRGGITTPGSATITVILDIGGQDGMWGFGSYPVGSGGSSPMGLGSVANGTLAAPLPQPSSGYGAGGGGAYGNNAGYVAQPGTGGAVIIEQITP